MRDVFFNSRRVALVAAPAVALAAQVDRLAVVAVGGGEDGAGEVLKKKRVIIIKFHQKK